jgi:transcriptional regulator with XRE-family HTH domain
MAALGDRIRAARLRRRLTALRFAERMGVSRDTLNRLERGDATIAFGTYARALRVLGLDRDLDAIARDDELGRKLQDLELPQRRTRRSEKNDGGK